MPRGVGGVAKAQAKAHGEGSRGSGEGPDKGKGKAKAKILSGKVKGAYSSWARPLPAGIYRVPVFRGPSFEQSGFHAQDGNEMGVVFAPDHETLREWAAEWANENRLGAWSPLRSCVVTWKSGDVYYYKAGDEGEFDIGFNCTESVEVSKNLWEVWVKFGVEVCEAYKAAGRTTNEARSDLEDELRTYLLEIDGNLLGEAFYMTKGKWATRHDGEKPV